MITVAWRNLARDKTRLAISVGGVAFAVVLILLVRGLYNGFTAQSTEWIRSVDADIWVAQANTPGDIFHSVSLLPNAAQREIEAVPGVVSATPVVVRTVMFELRDKDRDFRLIGVDASSPIAEPPGVTSGRRRPRAGELVVDRVFARNADLHIGDTIEIAQRGFRVAGIARGGNTIISQYAWATLADVRRVFGTYDSFNFAMVRLADGAAPQEVADRIARVVPGTKPMVEPDFVDRNVADIEEGFLPIVLVLVIVAFAIGTAVIGLTVFTAMLEKRKEYGVLKTIGFSDRRLYGVVFTQSVAAGLIGLAVGVALTFAVSAVVEDLVPSFVTVVEPRDLLFVAVATLAMSVLASFVPTRPVARLDPAEVFRV